MKTPGQQLATKIITIPTVNTNLSGSQTDYGFMVSDVPPLPSLTYDLVNGTGFMKRFLIGDPHNMIKVSLPNVGEINAPNSINGNSALATANKSMYMNSKVLFNEITFKTSSNNLQFNTPVTFYTCNLAGNLNPEVINLAVAEQNTAQNTFIITINGNYRLDAQRGLYIEVLANQTLTVTMSPSAYTV